jgi:hypothetical protein
MAFQSPAAKASTKMQKALLDRVLNPETEDKSLMGIVNSWLELERFKRELRGIPRLLGSSVSELNAALRARRKPAEVSAPTYTEVEAVPQTKESLNPQTVPTPPTPDAPMAGAGVV